MSQQPRKPEDRLVSVTSKDLVRQTFRCGGKGGQNVNKVETGVRFSHPPSGAVAESREERTQARNESIAFKRLAEHPKMLAWLKIESARALGVLANVEKEVNEAMQESNLRVEGKKDGRWVAIEDAVESQDGL